MPKRNGNKRIRSRNTKLGELGAAGLGLMYEDDVHHFFRGRGPRPAEAFKPMLADETIEQFTERALLAIGEELDQRGLSDALKCGWRTPEGFKPLPAEADPVTAHTWAGLRESRAYQVQMPTNLHPPDRQWWLVHLAGVLADIFHSVDPEEKLRLTFLLGREWHRFYVDQHLKADVAARTKQRHALNDPESVGKRQRILLAGQARDTCLSLATEIRALNPRLSKRSLAKRILNKLKNQHPNLCRSERTIQGYLSSIGEKSPDIEET